MSNVLDAKVTDPKAGGWLEQHQGLWNSILAKMLGKAGSVTIHFNRDGPVRDKIRIETVEKL